jgi:hypothetical protein
MGLPHRGSPERLSDGARRAVHSTRVPLSLVVQPRNTSPSSLPSNCISSRNISHCGGIEKRICPPAYSILDIGRALPERPTKLPARFERPDFFTSSHEGYVDAPVLTVISHRPSIAERASFSDWPETALATPSMQIKKMLLNIRDISCSLYFLDPLARAVVIRRADFKLIYRISLSKRGPHGLWLESKRAGPVAE